jgi:hypothetical protein
MPTTEEIEVTETEAVEPKPLVQLAVRLESTRPLIMHRGNLADSFDPWARRIKEISSKRKKTDEDAAELQKREFLGSMYYDPEIGIYIPSENVRACIVEGARVSKLGVQAETGIEVIAYGKNEAAIPFEYEGPKDPEKLWNSRKKDGSSDFIFTRGVRVSQARIMRTRPRFSKWAVDFILEIDTELLNPDQAIQAMVHAGSRKGLGDWRPRYGRFTVTKADLIKEI